MKLIRERPPLFDEIAAAFDVRGKPVLFAWGDVIYAPSGVSCVHPHLVAHEQVHGERQLCYNSSRVPSERIVDWWRRYLTDAAFRLEEEKLAHAAEFGALVARGGGRAERRKHLSNVASRLCAPLYRYEITKAEAREFLENGIV